MSQTRYCVGFAFSEDRKAVALIRKLHPKWQAGYLNGIGGHCLPGEEFVDAQRREFEEETGLVTKTSEWDQFALLESTNWVVACMRRFGNDVLTGVQTRTDEEVKIYKADDPFLIAVPNLRYLLPLALDEEQTGVPTFFYSVDKS